MNLNVTISGWLKEGKYKPGDKLPGENILASQLTVSGTLTLLNNFYSSKCIDNEPIEGFWEILKRERYYGGLKVLHINSSLSILYERESFETVTTVFC